MLCIAASLDRPVADGSKADISACPIDVRFTPKSGHRETLLECPLCAKMRLRKSYWITLSARATRPAGKSKRL